MQQEQQIILEILNRFQWHYRRFDICRLRFSELLHILKSDQQKALLRVCELNKQQLSTLDTSIPPKDKLYNPYRFDLYSRRFVRVSPELWLAFDRMSSSLTRVTGQSIKIISGYRSPAYQSMLYLKELYVNNFDVTLTKRVIQLPGKSEHQDYNKLAIDIGSSDDRNELIPTSYNWLNKNAHLYGFVNSYPKKSGSKGIDFEPWHWCFSVNQ